MKILQTQVNFVYPQIENYRKKFICEEQTLSEYFLPATILPVPDAVEENIPRIVAQTKNGHSLLNIALNVSSLATVYDNKHVTDWKLCSEYINSRISKVYELIDSMTEGNHTYTGIITNIVYDDLSDDSDSIDMLKKSILKQGGKDLSELYNLSCRFTYTYADRFFINITLENIRESNSVGVIIDINDKLAADECDSYNSDETAVEKIMELISLIINSKLNEMIKFGRFDLNE